MSEVIERRQGVISHALRDASLPRALKQIYANRGVDNLNETSEERKRNKEKKKPK